MKVLKKYFDYNATTPLSPVARDAWLRASEQSWYNPSSLYQGAGIARLKLEDCREALADLLGCGEEPDRVVFTSGATESNNAVLRYFSERGGLMGVSAVEHPSVADAVESLFAEVERRKIPVNAKTGVVDVDFIDGKKMDFVSVMAANNETGTLQPWKEIGAACREGGILYHCDAAQWIGKMPATDLALHCDFVTGSAHKFGGPKGIGFLVLPSGKKTVDFSSQIGGPQEFGFRAGTENLPSIAAMLTVVEEKSDNWLRKNFDSWSADRDAFEDRLTEMLSIEIVGKDGPRLWNTSLFILPHTKNVKWLARLSRHGFAVSTGSACSAGKGNPSRVMAAMGLDFEQMSRVIRVSGGWETKREDWLALAEAVLDLKGKV